MDIFETILTRRSVRQYTDKSIPETMINDLLKAAMHAPSAGNQQPWHFIVINDRSILDEIPKIHPHSKMLHQASVAILVCGDETLEKLKGYWVQDCSAATENILLAAHAKGLGAVWLGIYPREDRVIGLRRLLDIPAHVTPFALVSLGYSAQELPKVNRYDKTKIRFNRW